MIEMFTYRGAPYHARAPLTRKIRDNIIGLELEFNNCVEADCDSCCCEDCDYCDEDGEKYMPYDVERAFERLFDEGIIINPTNTDKIGNDHNAVIERDSSVDGEIILQADYQRNIMNKVNKIHKELNSKILKNGPNTSCHIHRNIYYLNDIGVDRFEYQKASEFLAGIFYKISGRDKDSYSQWCRSIFHNDIDISYVSMLTMGKHVDNLDSIIRNKYLICNCKPDQTVETRIFSNFHNFDPKFVKLYIDFTNLTIDIAKYMKRKSYVEEFDDLVDYINDFCNETQRRKKILKQFNLDEYIVKKSDIKFVEFNGKWSHIYQQIEDIINSDYLSYYHQTLNLIRIIRDNNLHLDASINLTGKPNFDNILSALNRQYNNEYKNV